MKLVQTLLAQYPNGERFLVTLLPVDRRVKPGKRISLDNDEEVWLVLEQYEPIDYTEVRRGWNNNY